MTVGQQWADSRPTVGRLLVGGAVLHFFPKCNNLFNAKCNNLSTQIVITFLMHNVIMQNVIISE